MKDKGDAKLFRISFIHTLIQYIEGKVYNMLSNEALHYYLGATPTTKNIQQVEIKKHQNCFDLLDMARQNVDSYPNEYSDGLRKTFALMHGGSM